MRRNADSRARGYSKRHGFTLMEILCAVFIVAILVTILSVVFNMAIRAYRQASDIVEIATKAQRFLGQITTELQGAIVSQSSPIIPFRGTNTSIYFMAPLENSSAVELCEVGYNLDTINDTIDKFFKTYNPKSTALFQYPKIATIIDDGTGDMYIEDVNTLQFRYQNNGTWTNDWNGGSSITQLPQMVEATVTMRDTRNVTYTFTTRVFIPGSTNNP